MAGEELLHGGLFEVALLGDELVQRAEQRIHIAQRPRDGALFGRVAASATEKFSHLLNVRSLQRRTDIKFSELLRNDSAIEDSLKKLSRVIKLIT